MEGAITIDRLIRIDGQPSKPELFGALIIQRLAKAIQGINARYQSAQNYSKKREIKKMENLPQVFKDKEFGPLRIVDQNGEPWFVAMDVAEILGYSDAEAMTRRLDADEKMTYKSSVISKTNPVVTLINESGLYHAILGSKKPDAQKFRKWVTGKVLPTIRKKGSFNIKGTPQIKPPTRTKIAADL